MILAIISDTHLPHGRRALPDACVAHLRDADRILHAGDLVTTAVLAQLMSLGPPVSAVAGNVDEPALRAALPQRVELELEGVRIAMVHDAGPAAGRGARMRHAFPRAAVVLFGHSHIPLFEEHDGLTLFNPGSPTDRRRQPQCTMGLAGVADGEIELRHVLLGP